MNPTKEQIEAVNAAAWVLNNKIKNENGQVIEFTKHRFLLEPYMDWSPYMVVRKAAQVGFSTLAILRALHWCKMRGANVIYTLPNRAVGNEFIIPKFEPLILNNPVLKRLLTGSDTPNLKKIGDRFLYFRGSYTDTEAIAITADGLINDESDKSDQKVLTTYESRLDYASPNLKFHWIFSNPSIPNYGVDKLYQESNQMQWLVTCNQGHSLPLTFPGSIDRERREYVCSQCHAFLSDAQRINGQWVAAYPNNSKAGYWITQLMCPWIPASKILNDEENKSPEVFSNFTLGQAWAPTDMQFNRGMFLSKMIPGKAGVGQRVMGVDNGVVKHWVLAGPTGVIAYGKTESWEEIEMIKNVNNAKMVIDGNPYPAYPTMLTKKYPGQVYLQYFNQDRSAQEIIRWKTKEAVVNVDRNKMIDKLALELSREVANPPYTFHLTDHDLEPFIPHFLIMNRVITKNLQGIEKSQWVTPDGGQDHWAFAFLMAMVALEGMAKDGAIFYSHAGAQPQPRMDNFNPMEPLTTPNVRDWRGR